MPRNQLRPITAEPVQADRVAIGPPEVEHRFVVDTLQTKAFLGCVEPHLSVDPRDAGRPVSYVLSTYYDTPDLRLFRATGRIERARIRLRQHATAIDGASPASPGERCAFEVKMSIFESRRVARLVETPGAMERILSGGGWRMDPDLMEIPALRHAARAIATGRLRPALTTHFRRVSLGAEGILITLDDQITFASPAQSLDRDPAREPAAVFSRSSESILEVKMSVSTPPWMAEAMHLLRQGGRPSKFQQGMSTAQRRSALSPRSARAA